MSSPLSAENPASPARRALSEDLAVKLVVAVSGIYLIVNAVFIGVALEREKQLYEEKSLEYVSYLLESLDFPLWNVDDAFVQSICESFSKNEWIAFLRVTNEEGDVVYSAGSRSGGELAVREEQILHEGELVGRVEIGLSPKAYRTRTYEALWEGAVTIAIVIIVLAGATRIILARTLGKPLESLVGQIDEIAAGRYVKRELDCEHRETAAIVAKFGHMAERIQAREDALRESEDKHRRLIDNLINSFVYRQAIDGDFVYVSPSIHKVLGYTSEEFLTHYTAYLSDHPVNQLVREHTKLSLQGIPQDPYEVQILDADGEIHWLEVAEVPLRDAEGNVIAVEGIAYDVTNRKEAEEALQSHREQLEQRILERTEELHQVNESLKKSKERAEAANLAKSVFLANMSHELRTPLNAILGFTQLLERDAAIPESQREELGIIGRSGRHLLGLINDVLDIAKIEAGHVELDCQPLDLRHFLRGIMEMFRCRATDRKLSFREEADPRLPHHVKADDGKLRQVMINLLGNAVKFTEQGTVTFRASVVENAPSNKNGRREEEAMGSVVVIRFEVEDTGPGIPADRLIHVFDPFIQADNLTQDASSTGTGLGLAISRQFVELMGGHIVVESEVGQGSVFRFDVPVEIVEAGEVKSKRDALEVIGLAPGESRRRILIVEDHEVNRILLRRVLESVGFEVHEAVNGQEGVAEVARLKPDLVWMDMRMPVMDGVEATKRIRQTEQGKRTPIIALTAHAFEDQRQEFLNAGCDDCVCKPFQAAEIFDKMGGLLGIEYAYEEPDERSSAASDSAPPELAAEHLAGLSNERLDALYRAAVRGAIDQIEKIIEEITPDHPQAAELLGRLAASLDLEPIASAAGQRIEEAQRLCELS